MNTTHLAPSLSIGYVWKHSLRTTHFAQKRCGGGWGSVWLIQFRAAIVDTHRAHGVQGTLIEKSWFVLRWRTWWGVCSEDWELNNVERQHTHTHTFAHTRWWCASASPCCSRCSQAERSRPSAQQHRENSSTHRQRGTRLTNWLHFSYLSEWETDRER